MDSRHSHRTILVVTALVLLADLASKRWAEAALADGPIDLGVITLRLAQNPGIAFSLGADGPGWVVLLVTSLATVLIAWMAWRGTLHPPVAAGLRHAIDGDHVSSITHVELAAASGDSYTRARFVP